MSLPSPGSSPILSYFLAQSPTKTAVPGTFPFNRKFGPPLFSKRRKLRLSLSSGVLAKAPGEGRLSPPSPPPNTAVSPTAKSVPFPRDTKPRRSATLNEGTKPRRAPSPMGERILKGHFDGFN
ncbi:hypothetical protein LshimejAT787_0801070 [Lyophyllum shimeji]|uniref:Uncharacterized protein n=1 Tax=Lyophyllum shimeji TaxID=47721 RepID=A0A9P3PR56_LYOSH|nr:hypothetical protein LshimejAT787_0801070 [Lyophyllum shimeji]